MTAFPEPNINEPSVAVLRLDVNELALLLAMSPTPAARITRSMYGLEPDGDADPARGRESLLERALLGRSGPLGDAASVARVLTHARAWIRVIGAGGDAAHVVMGNGRAVLSSPIPNGHEFAPIVASVAVAEAVTDLAGAVVQRSGRAARVHVVRLGQTRSDEVIDVAVDFDDRELLVALVRALGLPLSDVR